MSFKIKRLSTRLLLANLVFFLTMAVVVDLIVFFGFRQTQGNAASSSAEALTNQGRDALHQMARQEADFSDQRLAQAASLGQVAADYLLAMQEVGGQVPWDINRLATAPAGQRYDASPDRRTEVWINAATVINDQLQRDLEETAVYDALFPSLIAESPDAVAIYYMGATGLGRYFPVGDLVNLLPAELSVADMPIFTLAGPSANPARGTIWSRPYQDFAGFGPIVTTSTPVYEDNTFRGVISVDIALEKLVERLNSLSPTASGFAFLIDGDDHIVAASPNALNSLLEPGQSATLTETLGIPLNQLANPQVLSALTQMHQEKSGMVEMELGDQPVLLAYAPLPTVNWQLALVAPVSEIASLSQAVTATIRQDATATLQSMTLVLTAIFLVMLLLVAYFNRRLIVQRIEALMGGVRAITAGDLDVRVAQQGDDEIGSLAHSFNDMAGQLATAREELETRVERRTRELGALYAVTAVASASLDLDDVLNKSLAQVLAVMKGHNGSIHLLDDTTHELQLAVAHTGQPDTLSSNGQKIPETAIVGRVFEQNEPLYLPVMAAETEGETASGNEHNLESFLGAPLHAKGKVIGVLSITGKANQQFSQEEVALLGAIADQIGVAVENARLYRQAEALAVVQERQRLTRELHDAVTQSVYSAMLLAATGQRAVAAGDWEQVAKFLNRLQTITGQALKELRLLVYELRPSALENAGLVEALQHRLEAVEARAGIQTKLLAENDLQLSEAQETTLYRIAVEALNNALKHAQATAVTIRIINQDEVIIMSIEDDGRGFEQAAVVGKGGLGWQSMQERAIQLGGELAIDSELEVGTTVKLHLPKDKKA